MRGQSRVGMPGRLIFLFACVSAAISGGCVPTVQRELLTTRDTIPVVESSTAVSSSSSSDSPISTVTIQANETLVPSPLPDVADILQSEPPSRSLPRTTVNPEPHPRVPNAKRTFWVLDQRGMPSRQVSARLRVRKPHVEMWIEEGIWHDVKQLEIAAEVFESRIYPTTRAAFGSEWTPGVDNDPHILVLHVKGLGQEIAGYTSILDELPRTVNPFSNEAELIVVNLDIVLPNSPPYYALLARQLQRLIQWAQDENESRWVKEGLVELAAGLNGFPNTSIVQVFLRQPDTALMSWSGQEGTPAQRGAAYLFATYFHERFGDKGTRAWAAEPLNGQSGIEAALTKIGAGVSFEELFADWVVTNYLDTLGSTSPLPYRYIHFDLPPIALAAHYKHYPAEVGGDVQPYGADYLLLEGHDDLVISFTGVTRTLLLDVPPHSGSYFWWSNRADNSLATLTWEFPLTHVQTATLHYWTWYDLEEGFDYVTVEISLDGGKEWRILPTPRGTDDNPYGNNPGWGYTGQSGNPPQWIEEKVDLSPFCGQTIQVRFAYWTDEAITGRGFLLDNLTVPQLGLFAGAEEGETQRPMTAGFLRTNGYVPQRYLALLIGEGKTTQVSRLPASEDQQGLWTIPLASQDWSRAILVLGGLAPLTDRPAPYRLTICPATAVQAGSCALPTHMGH